MKKKNLKSLNLNKKSISSFENKKIYAGEYPGVTEAECVVTTIYIVMSYITNCNGDPSDSLSCWNDSCGCPSVVNAC